MAVLREVYWPYNIQFPDDIAQVSDNITQLPDDIAQVSDNITQLPDDIAQLSDNTAQLPDNIKKLYIDIFIYICEILVLGVLLVILLRISM